MSASSTSRSAVLLALAATQYTTPPAIRTVAAVYYSYGQAPRSGSYNHTHISDRVNDG